MKQKVSDLNQELSRSLELKFRQKRNNFSLPHFTVGKVVLIEKGHRIKLQKSL